MQDREDSPIVIFDGDKPHGKTIKSSFKQHIPEAEKVEPEPKPKKPYFLKYRVIKVKCNVDIEDTDFSKHFVINLEADTRNYLMEMLSKR